MGSGGPSTRTLIEAAEITVKNNSLKRIGPFAVPKAMSSTASATLATWFKIHGVNYLDLVGLLDLGALHRQCRGDDPVGQAGHDVRRRPRRPRLDHVEPVRRHGRHVLQVQRHAGNAPRAPMTSAATVSSSLAARACWFSKNLSTPRRAAPRSTPKSPATARPPDGFDMVAPRARARSAACARRLPTVKGDVDYINTHGTSTPVGDSKEIGAIRAVFGDEDAAHPVDQVADGPLARWRRRAGIDLLAC